MEDTSKRKAGRPKSSGSTQWPSTTCRFPPALDSELKSLARRYKVSKTRITESIVRSYLAELREQQRRR